MSKTGSPNGPDGPDDLDAAFSEIVADLRAEGIGAEAEPGKRSRDKRGGDRRAEEEPDSSELDPAADDRHDAEHDGPDEDADSDPAEGAGSTATAASDWRASETSWDSTMLAEGDLDDISGLDEDEHFVPPEPPPVQKPAHGTVVSWLFLAAGVLMLIAPGVIGMSPAVSLPFGVLSISAGLGLLLMRIKDGPPPGSDPENGAQV
ncbi:hypothetical protein H0B56_05220 [Haloechinothrix sp. YIM 98757]|uniref:DUF308 domain-containing protein n=1 Tax=Haloechinothrix aidingensis TaxID=2752311 RepID=A0A838A700_9PSEU|nr:hypothetical protein [Haloechinothrix aidingensis]MBA0124938.1 hypothetical protein [Haloechinothrix aidingensis]